MEKKIKEFVSFFKDKYVLESVISESEVSFFEKKYNITLPIDYKWFICNVAGEISTNEVHSPSFLLRLNSEGMPYDGDPSLPFIAENRTCFYSSREEYFQDFPDMVDHEFPLSILHFDEEDDYRHGTIKVGDGGCGLFYVLVVKGKEKGNLWINHLASGSCLMPDVRHAEDSSRLTFLEWLLYNMEHEIYAEKKYKIEQPLFDKIDELRESNKEERIDLHQREEHLSEKFMIVARAERNMSTKFNILMEFMEEQYNMDRAYLKESLIKFLESDAKHSELRTGSTKNSKKNVESQLTIQEEKKINRIIMATGLNVAFFVILVIWSFLLWAIP